MRVLFIIGSVLLAISARPLVLMGREAIIGSQVRARYSVERIISREQGMGGGALLATIGGHVVALKDDQPFNEDGDIRVDAPVQILVDGQDYSHSANARIRLARRDANRYWGFVFLMGLVDHQEATEQIVVAQSLGRGQFRTLSVSADGRVTEDQFDYAGRCLPPVRALLIRYVVSHPSGFCSDVMQVWPSVFYPVLYPWVSGALGLACVAIAGFLGLRRRYSQAGSRLELEDGAS